MPNMKKHFDGSQLRKKSETDFNNRIPRYLMRTLQTMGVSTRKTLKFCSVKSRGFLMLSCNTSGLNI